MNRRNGIGSHTRPNAGHSDEWLTPPEIVRALGPFDLDPCCPPRMPWRTAKTMWTRKQNGLTRPWFGRVWLNAPYSELPLWLPLLAKLGNGHAMVFARTETRLWFDFVWPHADALLFLQGRPHFHRPSGERAKGNSGGPVVLVAYGDVNACRLKASGIAGCYVHRRSWICL